MIYDCPHTGLPIEGLEPSYYNNKEFWVLHVYQFHHIGLREKGFEPLTFYTQNRRSTYWTTPCPRTVKKLNNQDVVGFEPTMPKRLHFSRVTH